VSGRGADLVARLRLLVPGATSTDHIGSTSEPEMAAKDCLDATVRVHSLATTDLCSLEAVGYRQRERPHRASQK
jgi:GrpB-like predicted nucleotidyltransferase (UPF0157 family)